MNEARDTTEALRVATAAARAAATILRTRFARRDRTPVWRKAGGELVTGADIEAEQVIREHIRRAYPDHDILGEEQGLTDTASTYRWFVDPLDGTSNFSRGNPDFAVSIALADGETLLAGIIIAPMRETTYDATRGGGARKNGETIHVSTHRDIAEVPLLWCEGHEAPPTRAERLRDKIAARGAAYRRIGSAAIECAAVAAGETPAYFTTAIHPWDVAAGKLLIEEAGGRVTDFSGNPFRLATGDFLATNGRVHDELVNILSAAYTP